jgi:hypothetical protein
VGVGECGGRGWVGESGNVRRIIGNAFICIMHHMNVGGGGLC